MKPRIAALALSLVTAPALAQQVPNPVPTPPGTNPGTMIRSGVDTYGNSQWMVGNTPVTAPSVAAVRSNTIAWPTIDLQSYGTTPMSGGGMLHLNPGDTTSADNGCTIFVDASGDRYYRDILSVTGCGADPTGTNSAVAAFQAAINTVANGTVGAPTNAIIQVPAGTYSGALGGLTLGNRNITWQLMGPVTWTTPPGAILNAGGITHVPSLAAMTGAAIATYPHGVWRDDYAAGLGAPPLFYLPQTGTCSAKGLVNDGGSCINEVSGNSFAARFGDSIDARQFGEDPTGTSDASSALNAAFAAGALLNRRVHIAGTPKMTNNVTATLTGSQSLSVFGDGPKITQISAPFGNAIFLTMTGGTSTVSRPNAVNFHDFGMCTGVQYTNAAISINNTGAVYAATNEPGPINKFSNLWLGGCDGGGIANAWQIGLALTALSNVNVDNLNFIGGPAGAGNNSTGIAYQGSTFTANATQSGTTLHTTGVAGQIQVGSYVQTGSGFPTNPAEQVTAIVTAGSTYTVSQSATVSTSTAITGGAYGFALNVQQSMFWSAGVGVSYGSWVQGVTVNQSNFTGCNNGVYVAPGETGNLTQLTISNSQFECQDNDVVINTVLPIVMITGNLFFVPSGNSGILIVNSCSNSIIGNQFDGLPGATSTSGVAVAGSAGGCNDNNTITGNSFSALTDGVNLEAGSKNWVVNTNSYIANTTNVVNTPGVANTIGQCSSIMGGTYVGQTAQAINSGAWYGRAGGSAAPTSGNAIIVPANGTLDNFGALEDSSPGAGITDSFHVYVNGADSALVCTTNGASNQDCTDTTHQVAVTGQELSQMFFHALLGNGGSARGSGFTVRYCTGG